MIIAEEVFIHQERYSKFQPAKDLETSAFVRDRCLARLFQKSSKLLPVHEWVAARGITTYASGKAVFPVNSLLLLISSLWIWYFRTLRPMSAGSGTHGLGRFRSPTDCTNW